MEDQADALTLTAEIVAAYVGNNAHVQAGEIPNIIRSVREALLEQPKAQEPAEPEVQKPTPAQIRKSVTPDALISFIDNKPYKTLKRHLSRHGMTFDDYRQRYGLPKDYPTSAPNYSARRSELAKQIGLGARGRNANRQKSGGEAAAAAGAGPRGGRGRRKGAASEA